MPSDIHSSPVWLDRLNGTRRGALCAVDFYQEFLQHNLCVDTCVLVDDLIVLQKLAEEDDGVKFRFPFHYSCVLPFALPFSPVVLEIASQLLLLTICGNHRHALSFKASPVADCFRFIGSGYGATTTHVPAIQS